MDEKTVTKKKSDLVTDQVVLDKLSQNFIKHLSSSRRHKKPRIESWKKVDDMLANRKIEFADTTVHIPLGKANGFMKTWLSKIDNPLTFKYSMGELADMRKAKLANAIKEKDQITGRWNWKDLMGKVQGGSYGRAIYFYTARSPGGVYQSELSMLDVLRFHIDPRAGGEDKEKARWLGWGNVEFTREDLEDGVKSGEYYKEATNELLSTEGNTNKRTEEDMYEDYRYSAINNTGKTDIVYDEDMFRGYRWFETINKQRYTMLITEEGKIIQAKEIEKEWESGLWPVWTWAPNTSPTEFWTLGEVEYQMYVFVAQEASISQLLENSDKINKPQRAINIELIKNPAQVKYRRDSYIEVEGGEDVSKAIMDMPVPALENPMMVYDKLQFVQDSSTGITAGTRGMADEDKVAIYEGNMQQVGDIFGLLNKSYSEGYYQFALLHKWGFSHITKTMAVKIVGKDGLQIEKITKRDLKTKVDYDILVESSNAEAQSNNVDSKNKITFLAGYKGDQIVNQKVLFEYGASIAGLSDDETKRLLDVSDYATSEIVSDANDIYQKLLTLKPVDPYEGANTVFLSELNKLYWSNRSDINAQQAMVIENYMESLLPIVEENMTRDIMAKLSEQGAIDPSQSGKANLAEMGQELQDPNAVDGALDITKNTEAPLLPK